MMPKPLVLIVLLVLAGCSDMQPYQRTASPCAAGEASMECQVYRYNNVSAP
jgi:hypothetical protein